MQLTHILDTLFDANLALSSGKMIITCPAFKAADGTAIAGSIINRNIVDGEIDFYLAPSVGSDPACVYTVEYRLTNTGRYTETWAVPYVADPGVLTISEVRGD